MLMLYITSIDRQHQRRTFDCYLNQFENAINTLSLIVAAGNTLVEVYLIEEDKRTTLSPQAFDGQDMLNPIQALQRQWEALLNQSLEQSPSGTDWPLIEMTLQRIDQFESLMALYDTSLTKLERLLTKTQGRLQDGLPKDQLLAHYRVLINQQYVYIGKAQAGRDEWLSKLAQLI